MNTTYVLDELDVQDRDWRMCHLTNVRATFDEDGELVSLIRYKAEPEAGFNMADISTEYLEESLYSYGTPYEEVPDEY